MNILHLSCNKNQPYCKENTYNIVVMAENFGQWLIAKRKDAGFTQGQLAKKAGISTSYVSTLERQQPHSITDAIPQPAIDVVESLAKALGENIDEARLAAGYAPKSEVEATRRRIVVSDKDGFDDEDLDDIAEYIAFKKLQKEKK